MVHAPTAVTISLSFVEFFEENKSEHTGMSMSVRLSFRHPA